ncbi:caspase family protein [Streptomyces sp. NPDC005728]|uniref:caspase family protein n=1 Tax=Streptomyces sp. NPDC005728 TaxID=3157054 RepID=UPI0033E9FB49
MDEAVLSDPTRSQAVLVGVHGYTVLEDLPSVAANLEGLRTAFTDPAVWGLADDACTVIAQPATAGHVLDTVREKARLAKDTLVVYYAGHGLTDPHTDELYLALPDSDPERAYTSLRYEYLRRTLLDPSASAQRTVLILDCCYSGRALIGQMSASAHVADRAVVDGTCVITASAETRPALSPPGETYTAFTGELVTTFTEGVAGRPDPLDMDSLYRHLYQRLLAKARPLPQQRNRNVGGLIAIARNRAVPVAPVTGEPGGASGQGSDAQASAARQSDAEKRLAEMEARTERLRRETEELRQSELRARQTLETAQRLAKAVGAVPEPDFAPFWFAVPVPRPLMSEDGSMALVAELATGNWYLAVERRGDALVAQAGDGRRGILLDTGGIQHGTTSTSGAAKEAAGSGSAAAKRSRQMSARARIRENLHSAEQLAKAVGAVPEPDFMPFWFAVPVSRPLVKEDGSSVTPFAELVPGTWYLAVDQRGAALIAQTEDGSRGLLLDTSGIQRG